MKQIYWIAIISGLCIVAVPLSADLLDDAVGIWLFDDKVENRVSQTGAKVKTT